MSGEIDVVDVPAWTFGLRIAQIFPAVIVLGLNAFGVSYYAYNVLIFSICNVVFTFIILAYMLTASTAGSKLYNKWAYLALSIFAVIMWLVDFSLLAALASYWTNPYYYYDYYYYWNYKRSLDKRYVTVGGYYGALAGSAGIAAIEFVMWVIQLVVFSVYLHRQRISRATNQPPPGYTAGNEAVAMGKVEPQVTTQPIANPYAANQLPMAQPQPQQPPQPPQPPQPVSFPPQSPQFTQAPVDYRWQSASPVSAVSQQQFPTSQTPVPLHAQPTGASELGGANIPLGAMGNAAELTSPDKPMYR